MILGRIAVCSWLGCAIVSGQAQTHTVRVNADGSFTPRVLYIRSGDTVRWENLARTDSLIPVTGTDSYPALCNRRAPFDPSDSNDLTGPMPFAPSGVYVISELDNGLTETTSRCPGNAAPIASGDNGKLLCRGGEYEATMDATWRSPNLTGVFLRLLWKDINPRAGVYDFSILQREAEKAVRNGKLYSLGIKAGKEGTPDWIFSTSANGAARADGGGGVPRLHFEDLGDGGEGLTGCGARMDLGNPARAIYKQLYFAMLTEAAKFIKSRADWYRAMSYIKISGANLFSHENRLPDACTAIGSGASLTRCLCSPSIFSADGYRPSGLYAFYDEQNRLLQNLFPGKAMSYALIQAGFPRVSETGGYLDYDGRSSDGSELPGATWQTDTILDRGQRNWGRNFVVQHNGVGPKRGACDFEGVHPKPARPISGYSDAPCPNRWVIREGAEGQITGWQTMNPSGVRTPADADSTFQNVWDNSDGVFVEVYEQVFWTAENTNRGVLPASGKTLGGWAEDLHRRRIDPAFPNLTAAGNPFPSAYSRIFRNANPSAGPQTLTYIHGMKCGLGNQEWGQIVIDAQPPSIRSGNGVLTAGAFGGAAAIAPGSWIEIYGSNLASATRPWAGSDFMGLAAPTSLDGISVRIGGQPAFIGYVSPGQLNAQVASNVAMGRQTLTATTAAGTSAEYAVTVNQAQPGLLAPAAFHIGGRQYVAALFPDGFYALPPGAIPGVGSRRARPGDAVILYGVGFGPVTPDIPAGQVVKQGNTLSMPFQLQFGQERATLSFSGLAPELIGLYQFNATVPATAASDAVPVTFTLGGAAGTQALFIPVGN